MTKPVPASTTPAQRVDQATARSVSAVSRINGHDVREADAAARFANPGVNVEPQPAQRRPTLVWMRLDEFRRGQTQEWFVKGLIPRAALGAIYGAPASGKSFLALDLAMALARGLPAWGELRVKKARVGYVVAEGAVGFRMRVDGYLKEHQLVDADVPDLLIMDGAPNLIDLLDVDDLIASITSAGGLDLVFVDTLARVTPGVKEGASEDMGRALAACERIRIATGAMVMLIAHVGKDETKGLRGWSGILGALDVEIMIKNDARLRSAKITKIKDGGPEGEQFVFSLLPIELGHDEDGDPITTCTVRLIDKPAAPAKIAPGPSREAIAVQVRNLLRSEEDQGRLYGRRSLHVACGAMAKLSRDQMNAAIEMLIASGDVEERQREREGKGGGAKFLHVVTDAERADRIGQTMGATS